MLYTPEDIREFYVQMKELLEKGLIRPLEGSYSLPTFMVMNAAEKWQNKPRMVINYKNSINLQKLITISYQTKKFWLNLLKI